MPDIDQQDWIFIKKRLELCETCSRDIVAAALGLLSLVESHKSVEEAESARVLALLGTVYLPLSLTAGILSMSAAFAPGQGQFWIFFVVAGPLMVLSLSATYTPLLMRTLMPWAMGKAGKEVRPGVKRTPTFLKESETV
jgi:Mg2+ and Co2+ transporter CorA